MKLADKYFGGTIADVAKEIQTGALSPVELVSAQLERIEQVDSKLHSYITVDKEGALAQARQMEEEIEKGRYRGPLHGIPIGLKDLIDTAGVKTTYGSPIYENHVPEEDAEVVRRLKEAGAIIIGKQHTHQFAYGPTGDRSHVGPARNPYDTEKMTGGSSSGSAAGTAAGLCFGSLGTDTGGSVRIPSSFCGVVGMKPTYGRVSKRGVFPLSWSLDHVGPITRTVLDNAIMLNYIAGYDEKDPDAVPSEKEDFTRWIGKDLHGMAIGIPRRFFLDDLNPEIEQALNETAAVFEKLGAAVKEVDIPSIQRISDAQKVILRSEAYAVHEKHLAHYPDDWDDEVKERLLTAIGTSGADFANALRMKKQGTAEFDRILEQVDVLLAPTLPILPPEVNGRFTDGSMDESRHIRWTITKLTGPTDLTGHPSISVPCGFSKDGMPIGAQLIGEKFAEAKLYQFAYALEEELALPKVKLDI